MDKILVIVEGDGDVTATPILVRRILAERFEIFDCAIEIHRRRDISHLRSNNWVNFKRYLQVAYKENCPILWTLDLDDDCPWTISNEMSQIVVNEGVAQPLAFSMWEKEYEAMFIYDFPTIRDALGIERNKEVIIPDAPNQIRGAKGWLDRQLPKNEKYKETYHQQNLTAQIDIQHLDHVYRAFQHFISSITWLIEQDNAGLYPVRH